MLKRWQHLELFTQQIDPRTSTKYDLFDRLPPLTYLRYFQLQAPVVHAELNAPIFQNQGSFPHALSETKPLTSNFFLRF